MVVNEASMVGTRQLASLSDSVEAPEGKLILIGDPHQLPELHAGGLFRVLSELPSAAALEENYRQRQAWERQALADSGTGRWIGPSPPTATTAASSSEPTATTPSAVRFRTGMLTSPTPLTRRER